MSEATATLAPPVQRAPDYEKWAAYWQEMRSEALCLVGEAFDQIAKNLAAGDARAAIDVLMFCADESGQGSKDGVYGAICDLLVNHSRIQQAAEEYRNGHSMTELIEMVSR